jgi:hypothetical protein
MRLWLSQSGRHALGPGNLVHMTRVRAGAATNTNGH